jgi:hypothetical protein
VRYNPYGEPYERGGSFRRARRRRRYGRAKKALFGLVSRKNLKYVYILLALLVVFLIWKKPAWFRNLLAKVGVNL